jgi:hypothetical protein
MPATMTAQEFQEALMLLEGKGSRVTADMAKYVYYNPQEYNEMKPLFGPTFSEVFDLLDGLQHDDPTTCSAFALHDNVEVLQFCWDMGFAWNETTIFAAVASKSFSCFKFALQHNCSIETMPLNQVVSFIALHGTYEMLSFLLFKEYQMEE